MNVQRDPDAVLVAWLEEGPNRLPEETRRAISFTTRTTHQTRRAFRVSWRFAQMSLLARSALAVLAVAALAGGALYVLAPGRLVGGSTSSTPTASPPVATVAPTSRISGALQIEGGPTPANIRITTPTFTPAFTFVAGPGGFLDGEGPSHAWFSYQKGNFMIVRPAEMLAVGGTNEAVPADVVAWLRARSDLDLAAPSPISFGGIEGTLLQGSVRPGVKVNTGPAINIACSADYPCAFEAGDEFGFGATDQFEIAVVNVRGQTLMLGITAPTADWDAARPALEAFLRSITFPPANS